MPLLAVGQKSYMPKLIKKYTDYGGDVLLTNHHKAHAASAFYLSPFNEAEIVTTDGVGEWAKASYGFGE